MIPGLDYLGGAAYKDIVLKGHPKGWAAGGFAREFGDFFPVAKALSNKNLAPIIRIQLCWSPSHNYTKAHLAQAINEAKRYNKLAGAAQIQLSPFCEHRLPDPDLWLRQVQDAAPTCTIVNNPQEGMGRFSHRFINEIHTGKPPNFGQFNFSYDGQSSCDADIEADKITYADAGIFFLWTWQLNCHFNAKDRTRTTRPTVELIRGLANLMGLRGQCSLPANTLWKSFAEQSDPKGDYRSNKPMCISPLKVDKLTLVRNGKVIGTLPRYKTPFVDGRQRYYLGQWGYKIATEPVQLRAGSQVLGVVNPGFRFGNYRD